jgi:hypothetical protein
MLIVQSVFCDVSSHPPEYSAFQIKASVADILYDACMVQFVQRVIYFRL